MVASLAAARVVAVFSVRLVRLWVENPLYRLTEEARDPECERQRRIVLTGLDRIDGLAGDVKLLGKLGLRPAPFGAEDLESILHHEILIGNA